MSSVFSVFFSIPSTAARSCQLFFLFQPGVVCTGTVERFLESILQFLAFSLTQPPYCTCLLPLALSTSVWPDRTSSRSDVQFSHLQPRVGASPRSRTCVLERLSSAFKRINDPICGSRRRRKSCRANATLDEASSSCACLLTMEALSFRRLTRCAGEDRCGPGACVTESDRWLFSLRVDHQLPGYLSVLTLLPVCD